MNEKTFTYNEVCGLLCQGCFYHLPDIRESGQFYHYVNADRVVCRAAFFKEKVARSDKTEEKMKINNEEQQELEMLTEKSFMIYLYFREHQELLVDWVEHVYRHTDRELAKRIVKGFHDETMDLSTIKCCKKDFHRW